MSRLIAVPIGLLFLLTTPVSGQAGEKNYCTDPGANSKWEQFTKQYPEDMAIHRLHALRLGLCEKIDRGDVTVEEATTLFNDAWTELMEERARKDVQRREQDLS